MWLLQSYGETGFGLTTSQPHVRDFGQSQGEVFWSGSMV